MKKAIALLLLIALPVLGPGASRSTSLALIHVTVIDCTGTEPKSDMTVVISKGRITTIGTTRTTRVPAAARVIDATGKYLIPGLWDMHTHIQTDYPDIGHDKMLPLTLPLFIANGVTGIRDMGGHLPEWIVKIRDEIAQGKRPGPRIVATGRPLDGPLPTDGAKQPISSPAEARQAVRALKRSGLNFVKIYDGLSREAYFAAADESKKVGIAFAGHLPFGISAAEASRAGQKSIEHLGLGRIREACFEYKDDYAKAALDPDPNITARLKDFLSSIWDQSYDPSSMAPLLAAWLETGPAKTLVTVKAKEQGPLKTLMFLSGESEAGRRVLHYKAEYERAVVHNTFILMPDGKIDYYGDEADSFSEEKAAALFSLFKANGTWVTPTLLPLRSIVYRDDPKLFRDPHLKYVTPFIRYLLDPAHDVRLQNVGAEDRIRLKRGFERDVFLVSKMRDEGVELLAGTDAITDFCIPGFGLHDELALLVKAGLSPLEALQAATRNPARFLGLIGLLGTVEKGKIADLVLLDANPLEDIANTQKINAVLVGGKLFVKSQLQEMLAKVEAAVK